MDNMIGKRMRMLYSKDQIEQRVREVADNINQSYSGKPIVLVCILKGAFMFFADLVKHIALEPELDFIRVSSYGNSTESSRVISFTKDVEISLQGKHIILVDDVVDTGRTMQFLKKQMLVRGAASVAVATLVNKSERREVDITVDFSGFELTDGFIIGYGLDYAEKYREFPAIYVVE